MNGTGGIAFGIAQGGQGMKCPVKVGRPVDQDEFVITHQINLVLVLRLFFFVVFVIFLILGFFLTGHIRLDLAGIAGQIQRPFLTATCCEQKSKK